MKTEVLCKNEWLELRKLVDPENGVNGYVYSHEKRCNGKIISILPYRLNLDGSIEYLLRSEVTPCWGMDPVVSSITGGYEGGNPVDDVIRELKEEAGYDVTPAEVVELGICRGTKSTDTIYSLFSTNLTGKNMEKAVGDGSELEAKAHCFWSKAIDEAEDPFVYVAYHRLMSKIKHSSEREKVRDNLKRFLMAQEDLKPEFGKLLTENFWDLI